jgi:serine/threonine protein kinase
MSMAYFTDSGRTIDLGHQIGKGGEGIVYSIQGDLHNVAKVYMNNQPPEVHQKLLSMVANPPSDPTLHGPTKHRSIAWSSEVLYSDRQKLQFVGFIMPFIDMKNFQKILSYLNYKSRKQTLSGAFTWLHLHATAHNLASCIAAIHEKGYCVGDLNESNILVQPSTPLTVIDCDSFQVRDATSGKLFRCKVGKPEYTAPEIIDYKYADIDRTQETDCFALGVMIFQLLMEGFHPYQARGRLVDNAPSPRDKIKLGIFPYNTGLKGIEPPEYAPSFNILAPEIQALFIRCFDAGHKDPSVRPTAKEWMAALRSLLPNFITCKTNENHRYLPHTNCPWCDRLATLGEDYNSFPSPVGMQFRLPDPNNQMGSKQEREAFLQTFIEWALMDNYISPQEEASILNQGQKIGISEKDIRKLIDKEIRKRGLLPGGNPPMLTVDRTDFAFRDVKKGSIFHETIEISNTGEGVLTGTISSNVQWITIQGTIAPNVKNQSQKVQLTVDTSNLPFGFSGTGKAVIKTNGGDTVISVSLTTEGLSILLGKVRASYIPLSASIFGFIGSFLRGPNLWGLAYISALFFGMWYKLEYIREQGIKRDLERVKQIALGFLMGWGGLIVVSILKAIFESLSRFSGFLIGASVFGVATYLFSKKGLELSLNKGINISKYPPAVMQVASVGIVVLAIIVHSGGGPVVKKASYTPAPVPAAVPSPKVPVININNALIAAGLDNNQVPFGVSTSFSSENKRLYYYVSYNGAVPDRTVFVYKWYKHGNLINEAQFTLKYASGNAWNYLDYDFQPGTYEVRLYVEGREIQKSNFRVEEKTEPLVKTKPLKITRSVIAEGLDSSNNPIGIGNDFSAGNRSLYCYVTYTEGIPDKTILEYRWYKGGNEIRNFKWTIKDASGYVWNYLTYNFEPGTYEVRLYVDGHEIQKNIFRIKEKSEAVVQTKPFRVKTWGFGPGGGKGVDIQLVSADVGKDRITIGFSVKSEDHKDILLYGKALQPEPSGRFYGESLYIVDDRGKKVYTTTGFVGGRQSKFNSSANQISFDPGEEIIIFAEFPQVSEDAKSFKFVSPMLHGHQNEWWWDRIALKSFKVKEGIPSPLEQVKPSSPSALPEIDIAGLENRIQTAFSYNIRLKNIFVKVDENLNANLRGYVETQGDKVLAIDIARSYKEINQVNDQIQVKLISSPPLPPPPPWLRKKLK